MPRGQNLVQSRELPNQETNGKLFGEDYDDPFQGMEPIFGLETSESEEKKKTELLKKIKSFGL